MDRKKAKEEVENLVEKYNRILEKNRVKKYNEEMTKKDFILPLFRSLGWKVEDSSEVTAEEKISKRRVDYGFRIDGIPKFFLEAKSLKADLDDPKFFKQAISYAWHKGCTWAVLTDFEAVKILNAEWKAAHYLQSHFTTIHSHQFLDRFDELWLLSKESFEKGSLDKEAEKWGKKTKKSSIDKQLLADFTRFRGMLSQNITKLNESKNLIEEELDESVQRILDRLIFIRNCEDRELEAKTLISNLRDWRSRGRGQLVKSLREVFAYFDKEYNSKIFAEHLCDHLEIGDAVLDEIIRGLYYTKEEFFSISYDFSAIEADVLGNIYEQYLSHILKKTEKRAKLTENQIHRKERGIYYTPTYIVDYIARNTLGEILQNKKINVEKIRVLDPACGSGSFLIKAYDILDEYYKKKEKDYAQTQLDLTAGLPFTKRVKILQDNIFGVDLDKQAVEIAQLNLLLKIAEKGHRLPLLEKNIKCGNSLIDDERIVGGKAFKWDNEFEEIMKEGDFDVVIGNPPYVNVYLMDERERRFFNETGIYKTPHLKYDLYTLFIEKGILLRNRGYLGFIVPYSVLNQPYAELLRKYILDNCCIVSIVDLSSYYVFQDSSVKTVILVLRKEDNKTTRDKNEIKIIKQGFYSGTINDESSYYVGQSHFEKTHQYMFRLEINEQILSISKKIENLGVPLGSICYISKGIVAYSKKDDRKKDDFLHNEKISSKCVPYLEGKDVEKYSIQYKRIHLEYDPLIMSRPTFPELHENKKILVRAMSNKLLSTFDDIGYYVDQKLICCSKRALIEKYDKASKKPKDPLAKNAEKYDEKYIVGLLNSSIMWFYYKSLLFGGLSIHPEDIRNLPIRKIDFSKSGELKMHNGLVDLVDKMLTLNQDLSKIGDKKTDDRTRIENEIKKIDHQIDELAYEIYEINETEHKIIEDSL